MGLALLIIGGWIASVCIHEFAHAIVAYWGGDRSVKDKGYLTFNPLKYTHPIFSIFLPLVMLMLGGLGLPGGAVYIRHDKLYSRMWASAVSAAGPLATGLLGIVMSIPFWFGASPDNGNWFWLGLAFLVALQISAFFFNLLPIPPLDGFGIIEPWLSPDLATHIKPPLQRFGSVLLFVLILLPGPYRAFVSSIDRVSLALDIEPAYRVQALAAFRPYTPLVVILLVVALVLASHQWTKQAARQEELELSLAEREILRIHSPDALAAIDRHSPERQSPEQQSPDPPTLSPVLSQEITSPETSPPSDSPHPYSPRQASDEQWVSRGKNLLKYRDFEAALSAFQQAISENHHNALAWHFQGKTLASLGRYADASRAQSQAIECQENFPDAWFEKGVMLVQLQKYRQAVNFLAMAIAQQPERHDVWQVRGDARIRLEDYEAALADYNRALSLEPNDGLAFAGRSIALAALQQFDDAAVERERAVEAAPHTATVMYRIAASLCLSQQVEEAIAPLEQALKWNPQLETRVKADPWFTGLRTDSRFIAAVDKATVTSKNSS